MAAKCPLCNSRTAKRQCPAKASRICSVCCGTKREVEIDCPSDCVYLQIGRSFESERQPVRRPLSLDSRFDDQFLYRYAGVIAAIARVILEERQRTPSMLDQDVVEAYKGLQSTTNTLSSGLYYETVPENNVVAAAIFRRLKSLFDQMMQPQPTEHQSLKVTDAIDVLDFMTAMTEVHSSGRPKSRKYLDWLATMSPDSTEQNKGSSLIVP